MERRQAARGAGQPGRRAARQRSAEKWIGRRSRRPRGKGSRRTGTWRIHTSEYYTQNTISEDGARTFFSDVETGIVYMREPEADRTVQVSAGNAPAYWRAATPSGSFVFYTEGEDLDRYDAADGQREPLTTGTPGVLGTLWISNDGSYVYFVATAKLAGDKNGNGEAAEAGADNLYEWQKKSRPTR